MIPIIPKPNETLDKINNFLSNKDLLIQTEKEYIHSIYNNFDDESFKSKLNNFTFYMLGFFKKDIFICISGASRSYLVKLLQFYFKQDNFRYHIIYHTKLPLTNHLLYFIKNLSLYKYDENDNIYKYLNSIYFWISKYGVKFKLWNDDPIAIF